MSSLRTHGGDSMVKHLQLLQRELGTQPSRQLRLGTACDRIQRAEHPHVNGHHDKSWPAGSSAGPGGSAES